MAKTRGAVRRENQAAKRLPPDTEAKPESDSTVRQWGRYVPSTRKQRRTRSTAAFGDGVPWCDMPENALYKVFESLLQDKQGAPAVSPVPCGASDCSLAIYQGLRLMRAAALPPSLLVHSFAALRRAAARGAWRARR